MESIVQPAAVRRHEVRLLPAAAALTALGVVYGDIGTSVLYGFKQTADAAGTIWRLYTWQKRISSPITRGRDDARA